MTQSRDGNPPATAPSGTGKRKKKNFALSFGQQRLWVLEQFEPGSPLYNVSGAVRLRGRLDVAALGRSLDEILARHETLRSTFTLERDTPVQVIAPPAPLELPVVDLSALEPAAREREVQRLGTEEARRGFDLGRGPLVRARLLRLGPAEHVLLLGMPHIVSDGWSVGVFFKELGALYGAFSQGRPSPLKPLPIQYVDYAAWQRQWLQGEALEQHLRYWKQTLTGVTPLELKTDRPRGGPQGSRGARHPLRLSRELTEGLRALGRRRGATLFMTVLAGFKALLWRYTRQDDVVVGTSVANRNRPELEGLIGFFVNTLALRTALPGDEPFTDLLERVRKGTVEAYAHQDAPFDRVVEAVQPERDLTRGPLFQVMFELQPSAPMPRMPGVTLELADLETGTAKFDLLFTLEEGAEGVKGAVEYDAHLFDAATVARMVTHFEVLLAGIVARPQAKLSALPLLTEAESRQLTVEWNQTRAPSPQEGLFGELFEAQVARTPDARAVRCEERSLTYAELNARANQVAHALRAEGAGPERIVGVIQDRGIEYLVSLLGILKAGAAYLPLDPALPTPRLATLVEQSGCQWVLGESRYLTRAHELAAGRPVLEVEALLAAGHPTDNPGRPVDPLGLAYVLFTSGSTGLPKGAMIEHRGMVNHLLAKAVDLDLGPGDVVAQVAVQSFDVSIWQFLCALLVGGCTAVFRDEKAWEPVQLLRQMERDGVTLLETVPSHMKLIVEELESRPGAYDLSALRWFFLNGEALPTELCARWFALQPRIPMVNAYGPTECSDDVTHFKLLGPPSPSDPWVPINGTLPRLRIHVLDPTLRPVPVGVAGELCVGGVGVGRGYLNDPSRTASIYVPDPFASEPGARLYRTGDVVRYRADGTLEFLGRVDHQVKIRGIRIEVGEVESALRKHPQVGACVVVARQDGGTEKRLVAYVSAREGQAPPVPRELAEFLQGSLSAAMVPAAFVVLEALPLTLNGKVDRKALPAPADALSLTPARAWVEPRTPTEQQVATLWRELLGVERVGAEDSFFELGGHSLAAIQLISRLRTTLGVELSIRDVFEGPTVAQVAARIDARRTNPVHALFLEHPVVRQPPQPHAPLSTVQLPEWYMFELEPLSSFYNVNVSDVQLVGALDTAAFLRAWRTLVERHSALRMEFGYVDGRPVQRILPRLELLWEDILIDRRTLPEEQVAAELERLVEGLNNAPFNLKQAPVFRLKLIALPGQRFQLVFVTHHIVWDEMSTMLMARELAELYRAYTSGREPVLSELPIEYTDYAHWLTQALANGWLEPQRRYWLKQLTPVPPALDLPTDFPRPHLQTFRGDTVSGKVPGATLARLMPFLAEHQVTPFIFYLAVLNLQLHRLSRQRDFVIGTPIANRDDAALEPVLGLFATAMPMRCTLDRELDFLELLRRTRETSIDAYENHLYPSVLSIQEVNPQLDLSRNRLFSVMYGVQNNKTKLLSELSFGDLTLDFTQFESPEFQNARFDLTYVVDQFGEDTLVQLNYNRDLFLRGSAERMLEQFFSLADQVVRAPRQPLWAYRMLSPEDEQDARRLLAGPALPLADEPGGIQTRLSAQARRTPDAVALESEHGTLTYAELEAASERWAHWLRARGVRPEERVALLFEPSPEMVIALLAVLKAGGAYVPLHPDHPAERHAHVLEQSGARLVLTRETLSAPVLEGRPGVVRMEAHAAEVAALPLEAPLPPVLADQLAYVLYTSGTTGTPKGIEIAHRGLHNLLDSTQGDYGLGADDAVLFITPFDFDASVLDLFWPLSVGARVVLPEPGEGKTPERLGARVVRHGVTTFQTVPLMLDALVKARRSGAIPELPSLRRIICGGAYLTRELRDRCRDIFPCALVNHYGPTEVTVDATRFDCSGPVDAEIVPIGRPLANTEVRVLDEHLSPVPPGVKGELFVSSPGLARGYAGDPVRTALQFLPDPFAPVPGARMYRTGDLGRYSDSGTLHFAARVDKQVKVRGNRVELEEVESRLAALPAVARCTVRHQPLPNGGDTLVAHVELRERFTRLLGDTSFRLFTLAQRPELRRRMDALHADSWPEYFLANRAVRDLWPRLATELPDYQLLLVDDQDTVVGAGNAIPLHWDGTPEGLPRGWDEALARAFGDAGHGVRPNTLLMLTVVVAPGVHGQGLSALMLRGLKNLGHVHGLERLVVAVRPVGKVDQPELALETYCHQRREDGLLRDNWLRTHERLGARILRVEPYSQRVVAPLEDWRRWSGQPLSSSGLHSVREALMPVHIDVEKGLGEYDDPSVWMEHPHSPAEEYTWRPVDAQTLRQGLREFLPEYMIPEHYRFLPALPLTASGKVDERALPGVTLGPVHHEHVPPHTPGQEQLARIWSEVLEVERVGITDDFFELGGHSIRAIQLIARVNEAFPVGVALKDLLRERTILGLEKRITALTAERAEGAA